MERTFLLPNGVQAGVTTTEPPSHSPTVRFGKDMPVLFHVSNAEAQKRVICRFGELTKEEREGICSTTKETAIQTALQATRNHAEQLDTEDSQKQTWAVPVGIVVLLMILGVTIELPSRALRRIFSRRTDYTRTLFRPAQPLDSKLICFGYREPLSNPWPDRSSVQLPSNAKRQLAAIPFQYGCEWQPH